jgi:trimethylamine--corrinoid protein Co-methyltransferase
MQVDHQGALALLESAGARVNRRDCRVRFPSELVEERLALMPKRSTYHGRTPDFDFTLAPDGDIHSRVPGGAPGYHDLETGVLRRARISDWREFAILVDALPNIDCVATLHCGDVPAQTADLHSFRTLLENERKCVIHNAFSLENLRYLIEMAVAVRGSREALAERPLVHLMASPISPLFLNEDDTGQILLAIEYGLPLDLPVMPIAGITAPITLAGTLAQANAEFLGTMVLTQVAHPGHPMAYFIDPVVGDMRTGSALFAAPETGLLVAAISQLATELYGLPGHAIGLDADGFSTGQMLFQKAQNCIMQVLAGGKLIIGPGCVESTMALSPTMLVIDDEIMAIAKRWARGFEVTDETLAVDVLDRVGPRGDFLSDDHTIEHLYDGELMTLQLAERGSRQTWEAAGSKTVEAKARDKARSLLASHEVPPLADDVARELASIQVRADAELART